MTTTNLSGKRALVCGASQGIGLAIAKRLASEGSQVLLLARTADKLAEALKSLPGHGHLLFPMDLQFLAEDLAAVKTTELTGNSPKDSQLRLAILRNLLSEIQSAPVEILINNAGGPAAGSLLESQVQGFATGFSSHVLASHCLLQLLAPAMKQSGYGRVVNIISTSVKTPIVNLGVSNTIRGAMASWSKSMANELGPFGITVNNVLPGYTITPRMENLRKNSAVSTRTSEPEVEESWKKQIPLRRFARAEEIANAVYFLVSDQASYISGINLPVDGGRTPTL